MTGKQVADEWTAIKRPRPAAYGCAKAAAHDDAGVQATVGGTHAEHVHRAVSSHLAFGGHSSGHASDAAVRNRHL